MLALHSTQLIFAHSSGHGEVEAAPTDEQVLATAARYVTKLVNEETVIDGKPVDNNWLNADAAVIHEKTLRHFIVKFTKENIEKALFIQMNSRGMFMGANYDGKFNKGM